MKNLRTRALLAAFVLAAPIAIASPAHAQARAIGVVDIETAITQSTAYTNAVTAIQTTYKASIDQVNARAEVLNTEIQPLATAFDTARRAPGATDASVRPSYEALQARQQAAQQEIARLSQPVELARAYIVEQINVQLSQAVRAAMTARGVDLVVTPNAVIDALPAANITTFVTTEINRLVPSVQIVPPEGWRPGQQQQPAQPTAAQPQGR